MIDTLNGEDPRDLDFPELTQRERKVIDEVEIVMDIFRNVDYDMVLMGKLKRLMFQNTIGTNRYYYE